jgi:hypothetical protein
MPSHFYVPVYTGPLVQNRTASTLGSESNLHLTLSSFGSSFFSSHYISFHQSISPKSKGLYYPLLFLYISYTLYLYILPWSTKLRRPQPEFFPRSFCQVSGCFYVSSGTFSTQLRAQQSQVNGWHYSLPPTSRLQVSTPICLRMIVVQLASTRMERLQRLRYHQMCDVIDFFLM